MSKDYKVEWPIKMSDATYYEDGRKLTTTDKIVIAKNHDLWWLPNTYSDICEYGSVMCGFDTKEEAVKYYQKKGYTFTDLN